MKPMILCLYVSPGQIFAHAGSSWKVSGSKDAPRVEFPPVFPPNKPVFFAPKRPRLPSFDESPTPSIALILPLFESPPELEKRPPPLNPALPDAPLSAFPPLKMFICGNIEHQIIAFIG
jgi:hypothetical protein